MKKIIKFSLRSLTKLMITLVICLTGTIKIVAQNNEQFPPPLNFNKYLDYIMLGDWGFCEDVEVDGPFYCSYFSWDEPDLSETESQLIAYKVYNYTTEQELTLDEIPFSEAHVIRQTLDMSFEISGAFMGYTWVTALYSDPDGESEPSNIKSCLSIPINIDKHEIKPHSIVYNNQMKSVEVVGIEDITSIEVYSVCGKLITTSKANNVKVKQLNDGVYILKITSETGGVISDKLLIQ
ncbi:MAG: T9SS type A sorting domain-containing protein [Bacteroidales bacterium]|nr:T9SS type A sorting domain-containing protein [Bacteroidales bacterium]